MKCFFVAIFVLALPFGGITKDTHCATLTKSPCYNGALLSPSLLALLYNEIHLTFRRLRQEPGHVARPLLEVLPLRHLGDLGGERL